MALLVGAVSVFGGVSAGLLAGGSEPSPGETFPTDPPTFDPPPPVYSKEPREEPTEEEDRLIRATFEKESTGTVTYASGEETAGSTITIAGQEIRLPEDAYVESEIIFISCIEGSPCPPTPYYVLQRGDSVIGIDAEGVIWEETLAVDDDKSTFDFAKEALR